MDFILLLCVTAVLFLRPQDLTPALAAVPLYNLLMPLALLAASPAIIGLLRASPLTFPSLSLLLLAGILLAIVISLLAREDHNGAWRAGSEFAKVAAYFVVLVAALRTTRRFTIFLGTLVVLTLALTGIATAHFHGQLDIPAITHAREISYDAESGAQQDNIRLAAYGLFADPNDLSMLVVVSILLCLGAVGYRRLGHKRWLMLFPVGFLGYALALTQSRGGLLALFVGLAVLLVARFGMIRSAIAALVLLPLLFYVYQGRQSDFISGIAQGTGSQRTDLWFDALQAIKESPLVGIGHGEFVKRQGLVAHSSYLHALAEWGVPGGACFIGLFYLVLFSTWRIRDVRAEIRAPVLRALWPYMLGALVAYATSILTLTRCDVVPTYLIAGLGVSYDRLARRGTTLAPLRLNAQLAASIAGITVAFLAATYVYIRFIYRLF